MSHADEPKGLLEMVERAQGGDDEAIDALPRVLRPLILRHCLRVLGDAESAEDATQETLIRLLSRLHRIDLGKNLLAYVRATTVNLCIDRLRSTREKATLSEESIPEPVDCRDGPEEILLAAERDAYVQGCISMALGCLSEEELALITLCYFRKLSWSELRDRWPESPAPPGWLTSQTNTSNHKRKALEKLRRCLSSMLPPP
ncbi:MAG TPA: sigma-70 family RNA polymerase sigma factor [Armatimonadota bacterium]|jgi:RNA polymerase sigma-70 factor (ECF subfamily)